MASSVAGGAGTDHFLDTLLSLPSSDKDQIALDIMNSEKSIDYYDPSYTHPCIFDKAQDFLSFLGIALHQFFLSCLYFFIFSSTSSVFFSENDSHRGFINQTNRSDNSSSKLASTILLHNETRFVSKKSSRFDR